MRYLKLAMCVCLVLGLSSMSFAKGAGKGYMGGSGVMVDSPKGDGHDDTGGTDGPGSDSMSTTGELYGDLYKILRYQGGEDKQVPVYINEVFDHWETATAVGGEPILTEDFATYIDDETGAELVAPSPSQCIQPVANYERWGDLSDPVNFIDGVRDYSGIEANRIPLIMTYDATWDRTEFAVGMAGRDNFIEAGETWTDPTNGPIIYAEAVPWSALVQEVSFGRLNQARAPVAVHQAAFDEAIASINAAVAIGVDASGRIVLTKQVFDEILVDEDGKPLLTGTVDKAIDSPLENLALYLKVMQDGHILTPGDERAPIDRSGPGGIPISMLLELEDGPSTALRPTLTQEAIDMLRNSPGLGHLVPAEGDTVTYYTWFEEVTVDGEVTELILHSGLFEPTNVEYEEWFGIPTSINSSPDSSDFESCAAFLAAAADKSGKITVDKVVYLNSIMGLNKVVGISEDGTDYTRNPEFYDFSGMNTYNRETVFNGRPWRYDPNVSGDPADPTGQVIVLQLILDEEGSTTGDPTVDDYLAGINAYAEYDVPIISDYIDFREYGLLDGFPDGNTATFNIAGFAQQTDDDLSVIDFVHTYQIPENR